MSDEAPFSAARRAKWPVPPEVQGASANDAFMWYCAEGMRRFYPTYDGPETTFYSDFWGHTIRCGSLRLTLRWDDPGDEDEPL